VANGELRLTDGSQIWQILGPKFGEFGYAVLGRMLVKLNEQRLFAWRKI
jgi:hypothetical protein